jgi:hypothetical protein
MASGYLMLDGGRFNDSHRDKSLNTPWMRHLIVSRQGDDDLCDFIDEGRPCLDRWPSDASSTMDKKFKGTALHDFLRGPRPYLISSKARRFFEDANVGPVEFLPVRILNQQGALASSDYFVLHPLRVVDCIDFEASGATMDGEELDDCEKLVLREDAIPSDGKLFRLKAWRSRIVIRRDLADAAKSAGLTNPSFVEPGEYNTLY